MSVELTKLVNGTIVQRARFIITHLHDDGWRVQLVLRADDPDRYAIRTETVATETAAIATVFHQLVSYFLDFSHEELGGAEITWQVAVPQDTPPQHIELAQLIAGGVEEALVEELAEELAEQETEARRRRGQPITWGSVDKETGAFTPQYTEYPGVGGRPTRVVYADGSVAYVDDEGELMDEHGNRVTEEDKDVPPRHQRGDEG